MNKSQFLATGSYVPKKILSNEELSKFVDTNNEWILSRTGIKERRIIAKGETCSDLAFEASKKALEQAGLTGEDLDMIILATLTPQKRVPCTASFLQDKLKASKACAYDIDVSCSGFVYGLSIADQFIKTGAMKCILVVGTEVMSEVINWKDRTTCVLFGDGAGAAILGPKKGEGPELLSTHLYSNGALEHLLNIPAGGTEVPWTPDVFERGEHLVQMKGKEVFKEAVKCMCAAATDALEKANVKLEDVDIFIPHQANMRIIDAVGKRLNFPKEKTFINVHKYGNTSGASIPIALDEAVREGKIKKGSLVLMVTFGAGFAWGSALIKW